MWYSKKIKQEKATAKHRSQLYAFRPENLLQTASDKRAAPFYFNLEKYACSSTSE